MQRSRQIGLDIIGFADDQESAIERVASLKPDAVIMDLRLREGSGLNVMEAIKMNPNCPVIIVFTNYSNSQYRNRCVELGADYFFDKSTEFDRVTSLCERLSNDFEKTGESIG